MLGTQASIGIPSTNIDLGFVNMKSTAMKPERFEHEAFPTKDYRLSKDWLPDEIESTSKEIWILDKIMRQSMMTSSLQKRYINSRIVATRLLEFYSMLKLKE
jgi:hypothetical protein